MTKRDDQIVTFWMDRGRLAELDAAAEAEGVARSVVIRRGIDAQLAIRRLARPPKTNQAEGEAIGDA